VTHEIGFARSVADEIMFMGEGKIIERGPPNEIIENPQHEVVRQFFKRMNELYRGDQE